MMNSNEVLRAADVAIMAAREHGVQFRVEDNCLVLEAHTAPPPAIMAALNAHKANIMASLKTMPSKPAAEDWLTYYRKRVVAAEVLEGRSAEQAHIKAFEWCITEWLNQHVESSDADRCAWCHRPDKSSHVVIPFGVNHSRLTWLHPECWGEWHSDRRSKAVHALRASGIECK